MQISNIDVHLNDTTNIELNYHHRPGYSFATVTLVGTDSRITIYIDNRSNNAINRLIWALEETTTP